MKSKRIKACRLQVGSTLLLIIGLVGGALRTADAGFFFAAAASGGGGGGSIELTVANSAVTSGAALSRTVTLNGVAAGDLIVVNVSIYDNESKTISSVSDGSAYSVGRAAFDFEPTGYFEYHAVYYLANSGGGNKTITVTASGECDQITVHAAAFSGVATSSPLRGTAVSATGSSTSASSGAKTDFTVGDLVIGSFGTDAGAGTSYGSGSGWASVAGAADGANMTWKVADATSHTATCSVTSGPWGAVILGFIPE